MNRTKMSTKTSGQNRPGVFFWQDEIFVAGRGTALAWVERFLVCAIVSLQKEL